MRRILPALALIVLAPVVAEVLPGSTPLTMPGLLLVDLLLYGSGALLIRELVRRRGRGWTSILVLGAAYGLIEEGLALQSLFNPGYNSVSQWGARVLGINGVYAEVVIPVHAVWSVAVPILLTDLLFPGRSGTPFLHRVGLIITSLWYLLGVGLVGLFARTSYPYDTPPSLLGLAGLIALVLVVGALWVVPRPVPRPPLPRDAPGPWGVLLTGGVAALVGLGLPTFLWRVEPAFARAPLVVVPLLGTAAVAGLIAWLARNWARARGWDDRHRLALAGGALLAHSVVGGLLFTRTMAEGVATATLGLLTIIALAVFALRVRRRVASPAAHPGQSSPNGDEIVTQGGWKGISPS